MPADAPPLVLLGKRRPALLAAAALGLPVILVHDGPVGPASRRLTRAVLRADLDARPEEWEPVARQLEAWGPIRALLAVSERTVRAAAWLRRRLGLPGVPEVQALLGTDKLAMKSALRAAGIPCADFYPASADVPMGDVVAQLGLPLVLKQQRGYGGRGTRIIYRPGDLPPVLPAGWLAERLIDGIELSVESFVQGGVLRFVHLTEYFIPRVISVSPNRLERHTEAALLALNRSVIAALGLDTGITHLEVFVTVQGPVVGEIALRPPGGHLMNLISHAYGFEAWQSWLRLELGEAVSFPPVAARHAAVFLLHPGGPGRLAAIEGWEAARTAPGVAEAELHVHAGDTIHEREGSGQESGYLLTEGATREEALAALLEARRRLNFSLAPEAIGL